MRKFYFLLIFITTIIIFFIVLTYLPKNYSYKYQINRYNVTEKYLKNESQYLFEIKYKNINYPLLVSNNYSSKRKLISSIKKYQKDDIICLNIKAFNNSYPLCSLKGNLIDYRLLNQEFLNKYYPQKNNKEKNISYQKLKIYNYNNNKILIWNYKGYYLLENGNNQTKTIFQKDNYENELSYQTPDYLIFPNYDSKYYFKKLYIYNYKKNQFETISFDFEIPYESYFLGFYDNCFYLVDKKNATEYEINIKKQKAKIISKDGYGKIWNDKWEEISMIKLINKNYKFNINNNYKYKIKNNKLYMIINNKEILISNQKITKIVYSNQENIYYLVNDILYEYNYLDGEKKLVQYSEWNFNNDNQIFIFNNGK